jgi:hypothetical protein
VLYGTTESGISNKGTVVSLKPPIFPGGSWTHAVLHSFTGSPDGAYPLAGVVIGKNGVLFGTTFYGGSGDSIPCYIGPITLGCGVVFSLTPPAFPGAFWTESVLHTFNGPDGASPSGVVIGSGGVLYGTTRNGGPGNLPGGTAFSLAPPASPGSSWTETVIFSFGNTVGDGVFPNSLLLGPADVLYGTTDIGGGGNNACSMGCGIVFQLIPPTIPGGAWSEVVLHDFQGPPARGSTPKPSCSAALARRASRRAFVPDET